MIGTRVSHELRRRLVRVVRAERISPRMRRIVVGGEQLAGFTSLGPDDHVKLFFPERGVTDPDAVFASPRRDYTPQRFDPERLELTLDFVLHGAGPASSWAAEAEPGELLGLGGPRASLVPPDDATPWVLAGDETALPAIGRALAELNPGQACLALIEVADVEEERYLPSPGNAQIRFLHRNGVDAGRSDLLDQALREASLPAGAAFRIAAEIETARRLRDWLIAERGIDRDRIRAAGYWRLGAADGGSRIDS
ncbi:siderophore-interacting protein [Acetobacteraceae bacterium KSS8]|uniref:Siderophore-interacting protein n=1 Tax=Endosaccharibacter trunci TaxID=2812733 RepID=A0ABT1W5G0_9PROT|nr:siderophore-interacting protein [Acetobacteraceae bacterium KSS8]